MEQEEELSWETAEKRIHELEQMEDFSHADMNPDPTRYDRPEIERLITNNRKCIDSLMYWKRVVERVLEPDELIERLDALLNKRLAIAQSIIVALNPRVN